MIRIVKNVKGKLNVWADDETRTQVYCNKQEAVLLFKLAGTKAAKKYNAELSQEHIDDFIQTFNRLNDFAFKFTDYGVEYYSFK